MFLREAPEPFVSLAPSIVAADAEVRGEETAGAAEEAVQS